MQANWKKTILFFTAAALLGYTSPTLAMPDSKQAPPQNETTMTGMPNPITEYNDYAALKSAVGFSPLYTPKRSGYICDYMSSIDGRLAELRFSRRWEPEVKLIVRSYHRQPDELLTDISGIHGVNWNTLKTTPINILTAQTGSKSFTARWQVDDYLFSLSTEGLPYEAFRVLLLNEFVDLSVHYYGNVSVAALTNTSAVSTTASSDVLAEASKDAPDASGA